MSRSSGRFGLAGREEIGNNRETVKAVGVNPVAMDCEGVVTVEHFEVDQLHLGPLRWPVVGRVAWESGTG